MGDAWAMRRVAAAGGALEPRERRPVAEDDSRQGLVATLFGLAVDATRLVERIETDTQWAGLENAAEEALGVTEEVVAVITGSER